MPTTTPLRTERLDLLPATLAHLDAELESPEALGLLLGARVPSGWPPGEYDRGAIEFFRERLAADPSSLGWYGWYALRREAGEPAAVVGAVGYLGPPGPEGTVEIGYSIAPEFEAQGYATEIVVALVERAWSIPAVERVIAHTQPGNLGSIKVLERAGFQRLGPGGEPGAVEPDEYETLRPRRPIAARFPPERPVF
jgi:ribosomal-protein-alanine N-acetyltransferase